MTDDIITTARMVALKEALAKFDTIDDIVDAAEKFHAFLTGHMEEERKHGTSKADLAILCAAEPEHGGQIMSLREIMDAEEPSGGLMEDVAIEDAPQKLREIPPQKNGASKQIKITPQQKRALEVILKMSCNGANVVTAKQIALAMDTEIPNIQHAIAGLEKKGFIAVRKGDNKMFKNHVPLRDLDGAELNPVEIKYVDGQKIIVGPARYAARYAAGFGGNAYNVL